MNGNQSQTKRKLEENQQQLFGLDAEVAQKILEKYDPQKEKEALDWIGNILSEPALTDLFTGLKNGVVLCRLMNKLRPGLIKRFDLNPKHALTERENIQNYLQACKAIGIPSQDIFEVSDLHQAKLLPQVIQNLFALGRQAQVLSNFDGPQLGVRYAVSMEDQVKRSQIKEEEKNEQMKRFRATEDSKVQRRDFLLAKQKSDLLILKREEWERAKRRRKNLGRPAPIDKEDVAPTDQELLKYYNIDEDALQAVYGMDAEVQQKNRLKYDIQAEEEALDWIEAVTKEKVDDIYKSLRSGVILCRLINCIRPNTVLKINTRALPLMERENIQHFLNACVNLSVPRANVFNISDLYEGKDLGAVVNCVHALGRQTTIISTFNGPYLKQIPRTRILEDDEEIQKNKRNSFRKNIGGRNSQTSNQMKNTMGKKGSQTTNQMRNSFRKTTTSSPTRNSQTSNQIQSSLSSKTLTLTTPTATTITPTPKTSHTIVEINDSETTPLITANGGNDSSSCCCVIL
eukprot:TRINITY_DN822_c0_g3_i1.p1 TRINITY_DN822_c0_g3~~TRINITY_DN822_c0_g3_i1.p1  ORF type:complete len:515 (-),score=265.02 TRINITY_DN822_c0_g3_i1:73-1617(-)